MSYEHADDYSDWPVRRTPASLVIVVAVLVSAGTAALLHLATRPAEPAPTTVPELVGRPEREARLLAEGAKLTVEVVGSVPDPVVKAGEVARQLPLAGARVSPGTRVQLTLSRGLLSTLPPLVGLPVEQALARLGQLGLRAGHVRHRAEPGVADGVVLASEPPAGSSLGPGAAVDLVVARAAPR